MNPKCDKLKTKSPYLKKVWAEMVMGRNGMGRNDYGPKWSWAEMVMGRNDPEPINHFVVDPNLIK